MRSIGFLDESDDSVSILQPPYSSILLAILMKGLFNRWLGGRGEEAPTPVSRVSMQAPTLVFRTGMTFPIVDWDAMDAHEPATEDPILLDRFWSVAARAWLEALRAQLGDHFTIRESERFQLLSALDERTARAILEYLEKSRKRIHRVLERIAMDSEIGKICVLIFENQDQYYQYVSNYLPEEGEFSLSSGMFLQHGYGHFVFVQDQLSGIEPTIAHELTHCLLQHLPIPAWLNEGIAVHTERRLSPPGPPLYSGDEMHEKHLAFWNEATIQEFWSGKSWLRPDEGNLLSYDLAVHFVSISSRDFSTFRDFVNAADRSDSGNSAALAQLGYPLAHLAEAVLGEGAWTPDPEKWKQGIESGQF